VIAHAYTHLSFLPAAAALADFDFAGRDFAGDFTLPGSAAARDRAGFDVLAA
jgi:hypothetical protein